MTPLWVNGILSLPLKNGCGGTVYRRPVRGMGTPPQNSPVLFDDLESFNVQAKLPGKNPESPVILIGAHYDSVPDSPGADDNASAVAALLEIARMLSENPPAGPVILMGFALEEYGFVGSQYWADDAVKIITSPMA